MLSVVTFSPAVGAEPGYSISLVSDDRFRGRSTSGGLPTAAAGISYDDASGLYLGASLSAGPTRHDGIRLLRTVQYLGYAHRVSAAVSLDAGVSHHLYSRRSTIEYARDFTQLYVGATVRRLSGRLFYSPDFGGNGRSATYVELDALLLDRGQWSVTSHIGALAPPGRYYGRQRPIEPDARIGLSRRIDRLTISGTFVGHGGDDDRKKWRGTFVAAASWAL